MRRAPTSTTHQIKVSNGTFGGVLAEDMATERDNPLIKDRSSLDEPVQLPVATVVRHWSSQAFKWELWSNRHRRKRALLAR